MTATKLQLPVQVIGSDLGGRQFIEDAHTLTVHREGATILLTNKLGPDCEVIVHNLETNEEALARVVGQLRKEDEGHVYAIAFLDHTLDLWHASLPPAAPPRKMILECSRCHTVREQSLSEIEMEVFSVRRDLTRNCAACKSSTVWKETTHKPAEKTEQPPPQANQVSQTSTARTKERRKNRRTPLRTPACVRCSSQDEIVTCEDISRGGFRFISRKQYPKGTYIEAAVPFTESGNNIFSKASIIYSSKTPDGRFRHGVAYLK
jgi:hypothetical protein